MLCFSFILAFVQILFILFVGLPICDNEFETKENNILKSKTQHNTMLSWISRKCEEEQSVLRDFCEN